MTKEQTRQLGIEFERRIQLMYSQAEVVDKLSTDVIYAMLNEYQIKYIKQLHTLSAQAKSEIANSAKIQEVLSCLTKQTTLSGNYQLPTDYFAYISSYSNVNVSYGPNNKQGYVDNVYVQPQDFVKLTATVYDAGRIIRNPIVTITDETKKLSVIKDQYTTISNIVLSYLKQPVMFNVLPKTGESDSCELPYSCFDELVDGAVQLYIMTYKFGLSLAANDRKDNAIKKNLRKLTNDDNEDDK